MLGVWLLGILFVSVAWNVFGLTVCVLYLWFWVYYFLEVFVFGISLLWWVYFGFRDFGFGVLPAGFAVGDTCSWCLWGFRLFVGHCARNPEF